MFWKVCLIKTYLFHCSIYRLKYWFHQFWYSLPMMINFARMDLLISLQDTRLQRGKNVTKAIIVCTVKNLIAYNSVSMLNHKCLQLNKLYSILCIPQLWYFGTSVRRSSRSAFGRSTGNDVSGHYKRHYFLFSFFLFFSFFSSPSSTFLIEGVLGSKKLFSESCLECPKT